MLVEKSVGTVYLSRRDSMSVEKSVGTVYLSRRDSMSVEYHDLLETSQILDHSQLNQIVPCDADEVQSLPMPGQPSLCHQPRYQ